MTRPAPLLALLVPWLLVALLAATPLVGADTWGCPAGVVKIGSCSRVTYTNYGGPRGSGTKVHEDWIGVNGDSGCASVCRSKQGYQNGCCSINSECYCHNEV